MGTNDSNNTSSPESAAATVQQTVQSVTKVAKQVAETAQNIEPSAQQPPRIPSQLLQSATEVMQQNQTVARTLPTIASQVSRVTERLSDATSPSTPESSEHPLPEVHYRFTSDGTDVVWRVRRFVLEEELSKLYECRVELVSEDLHADPRDMIGKDCSLVLERALIERRLCGIVRRIEHQGRTAGNQLCMVYIVPALFALTQELDQRIFQEKTVQEIVKECVQDLFGAYHRSLQWEVRRSLPIREYCTQYHETTMDFLSRILAEEGITFAFYHDGEQETWLLSDHNEAFLSVYSHDERAIVVRGPEMETASVESIRTLDWQQELRPTALIARDWDWTRPDLQLKHELSSQNPVRSPREIYQHPGGFVLGEWDTSAHAYRRDDGRAQVSLRREREVYQELRGVGVANVIGFLPGKTIQVDGHHQSYMNDRMVLTKVLHRGEIVEELMQRADQNTNRSRYSNEFVCVPYRITIRPDYARHKPLVSGSQTAIVVGPANEEIYCDEHGRVKVQLHWDRIGRRNEQSSCWVRVQQAWAGPGFGAMFIPRIGMEVVVSFLNGDPDRPLITGCVYHGTNRPPIELPQHRTQSVLRTKSSPQDDGFNELRFEDAKGQERIFAHAQKDYDEIVENNHSTTVHANQTNTVDANQNETVSGNQTMTVHKKRTKTVDGDEQTTIHQNRVEQVDLDETIAIGGNRTTSIAHHEKLTVHQNRTHEIFGSQSQSISGGFSLGVGVAAARTPPAGYRMTVINAGDKLSVNGNMATDVARRYSVIAGVMTVLTCQGVGEFRMNADGVSLESVPPMRLTRANAEIGLRADGSIEVVSQTAIRLATPGGVIELNNEGITITSSKKISIGVAGSATVFEPTQMTQSAPTMSITGVALTQIAGTLVKIN